MQTVLNGFVSGLVIATLALAFAVVYVPTGVFFVALAGTYVVAPYVALAAISAGWGWPAAAAFALSVSVLIAVLCEVLTHSPMTKRAAGPMGHLVASLGYYIVLVQCAALMWGHQPRVLRSGLDSTIRLGEAVLTGAQLYSTGFCVLVIVLFALWLLGTPQGLRFRALAENPAELALRGSNTWRLRCVAFAVAAGATCVASLVSANDVGFDPGVGLPTLLLAIVAMVIGGTGTFAGPILGGILLGLVRAMVTATGSARWQEAATFVILLVFIAVRPDGLLGRPRRLEATA